MKIRHSAIPASYLLLLNGNSVLLMLRNGTGYYDGWYALPAGHIEAGELPTDALKRESEEEIGIILQKRHMRHVHTMFRTQHNETGDRIDYFFEVSEWEGEPKNMEVHKCEKLGWFSLDELPHNIVPYQERAINDACRGVHFSELSLIDIQEMEK